ncbi:uncharacterized protein N7483_008848 [Penicillium malachiteum]|uniref:uncharacterized protein n=1 Tax=Penicillium malachiteum TaxID=1324776 RepID=UPI002548F380|nr:uncharacterized protein N7483_008848 [Penicillium malachiteum]KAJ5720914.1 hypothetical protein N7483_008848 [Penicillium malachiteum]
MPDAPKRSLATLQISTFGKPSTWMSDSMAPIYYLSHDTRKISISTPAFGTPALSDTPESSFGKPGLRSVLTPGFGTPALLDTSTPEIALAELVGHFDRVPLPATSEISPGLGDTKVQDDASTSDSRK